MRLRVPLLLTVGALALASCSSNGGSADEAAAPAPGREQAEVDVTEDDASTFALDVDTASYTYAARQIQDERLPDPETVRPEEFINYFDYRYREPDGDGFSVQVDGARLPAAHEAAPEMRLLRVGLQTRSEDVEERRDAALTFVIDVSGSMAERGRLDLVQDALHYLVDQLRPSDSVAIVAFDGEATVLREMTRVSDKERLHGAIDELDAGGSTNLGDGLVTGYEVARDGFRRGATNRVVILSDGLANTGTTDPEVLLERIREEADKEIALLGVGVGSQYGDELMEQLADKGDGFVVYISERRQAREVFVRQLPANLSVRAYDAKAQVVFDDENVESYRLVGYENRELDDDDFRDDRVDGGEIGPGHSVTALYLVRLRPSASGRVAQVKVRWLDPRSREASEVHETVRVSDLTGEFQDASLGLRVCYSAAFFAEALRNREAPRLADLASIVEEAEAELESAKVGELAALIRRADRIS